MNQKIQAQITGTVFHDYNIDGERQTVAFAEPGLSGITVKAFDGSGVLSATNITDTLGNYTLLLTAGAYRVEFSNFPTGFFSSIYLSTSAGNSSSVQFRTAPYIGGNFALATTVDYYKHAESVFMGSFVNGDHVSTGSLSANSLALTGFNYYGGRVKLNSVTQGQVGSTWGLAYSKTRKMMYMSAAIRRHAGFGPNGIGAIYKFNPYKPATTSLFLDLGATVGTISRPDLPLTLNGKSYDTEAFSKAGKAGMGDLDISLDENTLYVVNLSDRKLYKMAIDTTGAASGTAIEVTGAPWLTTSPCTNGVARPWALKISNVSGVEKVYVGGICDASTGTPTVANLTAWVYEYTPSTNTWNTTPVLNASLNYLRQNQGGNSDFGSTAKWKPWTDSYATMIGTYNTTTQVGGYNENYGAGGGNYAQPIFSDIEFDNSGDMILGFIDRGGLQFANENLKPGAPYGAGGAALVSYVSSGDVLRAGKNASTWTLENNGITNGTGGTKTTSMSNPLTINGYTGLQTTGPGGKEFYWGENYIGPALAGVTHWETSQGGLAYLSGKTDVMVSAMDAAGTQVNAGGVLWLSNINGAKTDGIDLYAGGISTGAFAKAGGLTDVEIISDPLPVGQVGNRIWLDTHNDGFQDPSETVIAGLLVELYTPKGKDGIAGNADDNLPVGQSTSTAQNLSNYLFTSNLGADPIITDRNGLVENGLIDGETYTIRIPNISGANKQAALGVNVLTISNANSNGSDNIDSDAQIVGNNAEITFIFSAILPVNHTFDIGFTPCIVTSSLASTNPKCNASTDGTINLTVSGNVGTPTYLWSNGATTKDLTALSAATYSVTVTDGACSTIASVTLSEPTILTINCTKTNVTLNSGNDGTASVSVSGATAPYTYLWSNGATTPSIAP